jgi:hypothetical protein
MITYYCICLYHHQTPVIFITRLLPSFLHHQTAITIIFIIICYLQYLYHQT